MPQAGAAGEAACGEGVPLTHYHVQSLLLVTPFLATSAALLRLNWFPSKVFVGDAYVGRETCASGCAWSDVGEVGRDRHRERRTTIER